MRHRVAFVGSTRLTRPLDSTNEKKFQRLAEIADVVVIAFAADGRPRYFYQHARFYLLPMPALAPLRYVTAALLSLVLSLWVVFRHGVYVLVAQSPYEALGPALARALLRRLGRPVALVVESHGDFKASLFLQGRVPLWRVYRRLMAWSARFALSQADALRSISDSTRQQLLAGAGRGLPIGQFAAWTDMDVFMEAGKKPSTTRRARVLLYAGVLIPRKGLHILLPAFASVTADFPDARLLLVGEAINAGYTHDMKRLTQELGISERVEFVGPLPQQALAELMASVAAFVLPSISEGLGRVVFEAMACGTPVVGSSVGGIPEQISDGVNGFLVPPGDVGALAERLRWMLQHPDDARLLGGQGRLTAEAIFSTETYLSGYAALLDAAVQRPRAQAG